MSPQTPPYLEAVPWELVINMYEDGKTGLTTIWIMASIFGVGVPIKAFLVSLGNMSIMF